MHFCCQYGHSDGSGVIKDSFSLPAKTQVQIFTFSLEEQIGSTGLEKFLHEEARYEHGWHREVHHFGEGS